jgi:hypothetical protein
MLGVSRFAEYFIGERRKMLGGFLEGMRLGIKVQEDWLVLNGAAYIWNYHLQCFKQGQYTGVYEGLEEAVSAMLTCKTVSEAPQLLASLSDALGDCLLQRHRSGEEEVSARLNAIDSPGPTP